MAASNTWMHSLEVQMIEGDGRFHRVGDKSTTTRSQRRGPKSTEHAGIQPGWGPVTVNGGRINWWGRSELGGQARLRSKDVESRWASGTGEVIADGGKITVLLNDRGNRAIDCKPQKGRIQVQSEAAGCLSGASN